MCLHHDQPLWTAGKTRRNQQQLVGLLGVIQIAILNPGRVSYGQQHIRPARAHASPNARDGLLPTLDGPVVDNAGFRKCVPLWLQRGPHQDADMVYLGIQAKA